MYLYSTSKAFVAAYVLLIPLSFFGTRHQNWIFGSSFLLWVNSVFIEDFGYVWLTLAYAALVATGNKRVGNAVVKYTLLFVIGVFLNWWCFGPSVVERLNRATGGHCEPQDLSMASCRRDPDSVWVGGFDLSGHYYFITSSVLLLANGYDCGLESNMPTADAHDAPIVPDGPNVLTNLLTWPNATYFAATIVAIWCGEFVVTSIFFHTVAEKAAGLIGIPVAILCVEVADRFRSLDREEGEVREVMV